MIFWSIILFGDMHHPLQQHHAHLLCADMRTCTDTLKPLFFHSIMFWHVAILTTISWWIPVLSLVCRWSISAICGNVGFAWICFAVCLVPWSQSSHKGHACWCIMRNHTSPFKVLNQYLTSSSPTLLFRLEYITHAILLSISIQFDSFVFQLLRHIFLIYIPLNRTQLNNVRQFI